MGSSASTGPGTGLQRRSAAAITSAAQTLRSLAQAPCGIPRLLPPLRQIARCPTANVAMRRPGRSSRTSRSRSRTPRRPKKNLEDQQKKHAEACRRYAASSRRRLHLCRPSPRLPPPLQPPPSLAAGLPPLAAAAPQPLAAPPAAPSISSRSTRQSRCQRHLAVQCVRQKLLIDVWVHQLTRVSDPANFARCSMRRAPPRPLTACLRCLTPTC